MRLAVSLRFWSDLDQIRTSLPPNYTLCEEMSPGAMKEYDDVLDGQKWIPSGMHHLIPEDCDAGFLKSLSPQPTVLKETAQLQLKQFFRLYSKLEKVHQAVFDTALLKPARRKALELLECHFSKMVDFLERDVTICALECIPGEARQTIVGHTKAMDNIIEAARLIAPGKPSPKYSRFRFCADDVPIYLDDFDQSSSPPAALTTNLTDTAVSDATTNSIVDGVRKATEAVVARVSTNFSQSLVAGIAEVFTDSAAPNVQEFLSLPTVNSSAVEHMRSILTASPLAHVTALLTQATVDGGVSDLLTKEEDDTPSSTLSMLKENITTTFNNLTSVLINSTSQPTNASDVFDLKTALFDGSSLNGAQLQKALDSFLTTPLGWSLMAVAAASVVIGIVCTTCKHFKSSRHIEADGDTESTSWTHEYLRASPQLFRANDSALEPLRKSGSASVADYCQA